MSMSKGQFNQILNAISSIKEDVALINNRQINLETLIINKQNNTTGVDFFQRPLQYLDGQKFSLEEMEVVVDNIMQENLIDKKQNVLARMKADHETIYKIRYFLKSLLHLITPLLIKLIYQSIKHAIKIFRRRHP